MIYVNNAATSYPKPPNVIAAVSKLLTNPYIDTGRSVYSDLGPIETYRQDLADFLGIPAAERLVFTSGATESLNMAMTLYR